MQISELLRPHINALVPYSSARDDCPVEEGIHLDANESWYDYSGQGKNRYPDPHHRKARLAISSALGLPFERTMLTNGSDEAIDLLVRAFCIPGRDSVMVESPTYGEYRIFAEINDVGVHDVLLTKDLDLDVGNIRKTILEKHPKIVFICSPNNPTGKSYDIRKIREIADINDAVTVVDEAYSDFDPSFSSASALIDGNPRVVVLRTFSKYWGLAASRIGLVIASREIIMALDKIKAPYNVGLCSQNDVMEALASSDERKRILGSILSERERLSKALSGFTFVKKVYRSDANFILVRFDDEERIQRLLLDNGIIVRNRSSEPLLGGCLRITIGSREENDRLLEVLSNA